MDRHDLYELCVTEPTRLVRFIRAVHARRPRTLREDFSGTAALAREWTRSDPAASALAVDQDPEPLARPHHAERVRTVTADVLACHRRADVIACTNFPLGYFHTRPELLSYLRHARRCLNPRGIFLADTYGGRDALTPHKLTQRFRAPTGHRVEYTFEQRAADPLTNRVIDALHFRVTPPARGTRATVFRDAFVYDWRLWSVPELADALRDAGFRSVEVYDRLGDAIDSTGRLYVTPLRDGQELDENYVAYVVGRPPPR